MPEIKSVRMDKKGICNCAIQLVETFGADQEFEILLPDQFVLLELTTSSVIEVHNSTLDAIVVSEICLDISFSQSFLSLDLDSLELSFILN